MILSIKQKERLSWKSRGRPSERLEMKLSQGLKMKLSESLKRKLGRESKVYVWAKRQWGSEASCTRASRANDNADAEQMTMSTLKETLRDRNCCFWSRSWSCGSEWCECRAEAWKCKRQIITVEAAQEVGSVSDGWWYWGQTGKTVVKLEVVEVDLNKPKGTRNVSWRMMGKDKCIFRRMNRRRLRSPRRSGIKKNKSKNWTYREA